MAGELRCALPLTPQSPGAGRPPRSSLSIGSPRSLADGGRSWCWRWATRLTGLPLSALRSHKDLAWHSAVPQVGHDILDPGWPLVLEARRQAQANGPAEGLGPHWLLVTGVERERATGRCLSWLVLDPSMALPWACAYNARLTWTSGSVNERDGMTSLQSTDGRHLALQVQACWGFGQSLRARGTG